MIREYKDFEVECDFCHTRVKVRAMSEELPETWDTIPITYGSGYYDSRMFDRCPDCIKKKEGETRSKD
jgi:hypothetical protein